MMLKATYQSLTKTCQRTRWKCTLKTFQRGASWWLCRFLFQGEIMTEISSPEKPPPAFKVWFLTMQLHTAPAAHTAVRQTVTLLWTWRGEPSHTANAHRAQEQQLRSLLIHQLSPAAQVEAVYARQLWQESVFYQHVNQLRFSDAH